MRNKNQKYNGNVRKHPKWSNILPPLNASQFEQLKESIRQHGVMEDILVSKDGYVIDGCHRIKACKELGIDFRHKVYAANLNGQCVEAFIVQMQIGKRNLSFFKTVVLTYEFLVPYYEELAKKHKGRPRKGQTKRVTDPIDTLQKVADHINQFKVTNGTSRRTVSYIQSIERNYQAHKNNPNIGKQVRDLYVKASNDFYKPKPAAEEMNKLVKADKVRTHANTKVVIRNPIKGKYANQIIKGECLTVLDEMAKHGMKEKVSLFFTSPFYFTRNSNKETSRVPYGDLFDKWLKKNIRTYDDYINFLGNLLIKCHALLRPGGKVVFILDTMSNEKKNDDCLNYPTHCDLIQKVREINAKKKLNYVLWYDVAWNKDHFGKQKPFGSLNASKPRPHKNSEHILIWQKGMEPLEDINQVGHDISKEDAQWFSRTCKKITNVKPQNSNHPCPFNPLLPYEYIQLFTRKGDVVVDPFSGEATTCWVSKLCGRNYLGVDMVPAFVKQGRDNCANKTQDEVVNLKKQIEIMKGKVVEKTVNNELCFQTVKSCEYETPKELFNEWNKKYKFGLDTAATRKNSKCDYYFDKNDNALDQDWCGYGNVWCNPPYGHYTKKFVAKAIEEQAKGVTTVMLIPLNTRSNYWHELILNKRNIKVDVQRRIVFEVNGKPYTWTDKNGKAHRCPAPQSHAIVIFKGRNKKSQ